jgi:hypothetical protein
MIVLLLYMIKSIQKVSLPDLTMAKLRLEDVGTVQSIKKRLRRNIIQLNLSMLGLEIIFYFFIYFLFR